MTSETKIGESKIHQPSEMFLFVKSHAFLESSQYVVNMGVEVHVWRI